MIGLRFEMHPTGLKSSLPIPGQCRRRAIGFGIKENAQPHHDLKSIADPEDKSVFIPESVERFVQTRLPLHGCNSAGRDVVPVTEAAGKAEDLKSFGETGMIDDLVDVQSLGLRTS
jgi:hypothetical protein